MARFAVITDLSIVPRCGQFVLTAQLVSGAVSWSASVMKTKRSVPRCGQFEAHSNDFERRCQLVMHVGPKGCYGKWDLNPRPFGLDPDSSALDRSAISAQLTGSSVNKGRLKVLTFRAIDVMNFRSFIP